MPQIFRDDHEAAIERADALEDELDETKRERDALKDEVEKLRILVPKREIKRHAKGDARSKELTRKPIPAGIFLLTAISGAALVAVAATHAFSLGLIVLGAFAVIFLLALVADANRRDS